MCMLAKNHVLDQRDDRYAKEFWDLQLVAQQVKAPLGATVEMNNDCNK